MTPDEAGRRAYPRAASVKTYARAAGILLLFTLMAGGFGEFYVPSALIVPADASATAQKINASVWLFRMGFAAYLIEAMCDIGLTWVLYVLLKPVHKDLALLAAFFRLVSTATFATAELFYFAAVLLLGGAHYLKTFSPDQLNSLALLSLRFYVYGGGLFMVFYGVASILLGYLIFESGYLPKALGVLLTLGGIAFVVRNFALVLTPAYASDFLLLPMTISAAALTLWFLVRGVAVTKWEKMASTEI
jgi:hypothetical protein